MKERELNSIITTTMGETMGFVPPEALKQGNPKENDTESENTEPVPQEQITGFGIADSAIQQIEASVGMDYSPENQQEIITHAINEVLAGREMAPLSKDSQDSVLNAINGSLDQSGSKPKLHVEKLRRTLGDIIARDIESKNRQAA